MNKDRNWERGCKSGGRELQKVGQKEKCEKWTDGTGKDEGKDELNKKMKYER